MGGGEVDREDPFPFCGSFSHKLPKAKLAALPRSELTVQGVETRKETSTTILTFSFLFSLQQYLYTIAKFRGPKSA